jgi:cupin 2 domain-containing protein
MNKHPVKNIRDDIPEKLKEEFFEDILTGSNFKLERIISEGHSSSKDFWYDQDKNEMVFLYSGSAELLYDDGRKFALSAGDYLIIPAHQKHRVEKTDNNQKTYWLALHY